jgi:autotransporter-associated beta strand protein
MGPTAGWSLSETGANAFAGVATNTGDTLNFGNGATGLGAGSISVGAVSAGNMIFASGSGAIVLSGGTITLAAAQTTTVNNASNTISSTLAGAATSFTKAGTGSLTLSGTNTYTGTTTVNAGTLILSNANTISGATSVAAAGTLQLGNATSMGTSTMTLANGATLQLRNDNDTTFTAPIATVPPNTSVTYNFDVNNAGSAVTGKKLSLGDMTFATGAAGFSSANQINVTGGNGYSLELGTISAPSSGGSGLPHPFTVNATTAAVTIAKFATGGFGSALTLQGGNAITLNNLEFNSNPTNSLTVSGSGTVVTLGTTTANSRSNGTMSYTLNSGNTLNLTTATSLFNRSTLGATFMINGGTLNNTSGAAITQSNNPATTIGGDFTFGTSGSTSANNLNLGTGAITNAGNRTITFAGTGTTLTMDGLMTNTSGADQILTVNGAGNTLSLGGYNTANGRTGIITGTGTVRITGNLNNSSGGTTINSGTLEITSTGKLYGSSVNALTTVNSGGTLSVYSWAYNGSIGTPYFNFQGGSPTTQLAVNGGTIKYTGIGENTGDNNGRNFAIGIGGATLDAAGSGTWNITPYNAAAGYDQTIGSGLTLTLTGSSNGNFSKKLVGTGALTKSGSGTWTLAGANTFTGQLTAENGNLSIATINNASANGTLGNSALAVILGKTGGITGTLQYTGSNATSTKRFTMATGGTGAFQVDTAGQTLTLSGLVDGSGNLTKTGAGTLALNQINTYTGETNVTTGILQLDGSTHASSTVGIATAGTLTGTGTVNGNATLTGNGIINKTSGTLAGTLGVTGGNWNGAGVVTGLVTSSSGTFNIGNGANLTANGNLNVTGGMIAAGNAASTITGSLNYTSSSNSTYAGVIAGASKTLTMNNAAATLTLSGTNTYTGATTVSSGQLTIGSTGRINSSSGVSVAAGSKFIFNSSTALTVGTTLNGNTTANRAVLGGTGTIGSTMVLDNLGDTLAPGNSPGIQNFTSAQTWSSFSYDWEINNFTGTTAGTDFDQIGIGSTLNLSGGSGSYILNVLGLTAGDIAGLVPNFSEIDRSWTILTSSGALTGFDAANWTINTAGFTDPDAGAWSLGQSGNSLVLSYTAVPEPNVAALLGGLGMLVLLRRRR